MLLISVRLLIWRLLRLIELWWPWLRLLVRRRRLLLRRLELLPVRLLYLDESKLKLRGMRAF